MFDIQKKLTLTTYKPWFKQNNFNKVKILRWKTSNTTYNK